ncbi:hypothetical protein BRAS3843_1670016 [Bradyrhizobium sp. STM 3843]|nr:hypothetical protein BRAS3843_1670016 [Bradyrhizobium sp. STM 3843]
MGCCSVPVGTTASPGLADAQSLDRILLTSLRHVNERELCFLLRRIQIGAAVRFISTISALELTVSHKTVAELARK